MADDFLTGGVDEAALAIENLLSGNAPKGDDTDQGDADVSAETIAAIEGAAAPVATEQKPDEEAPEGEMPIEAARAVIEPPLKAEVPAPIVATQEQPKAAPTEPSTAQAQLAQLNQLVPVLQAQLAAEFPDIKSLDDLKRLAVENPARVIAYDVQQREVQAALAQQAQATTAYRAEWLAGERVKLNTQIPELADPVKGPALGNKLTAYAKEMGYSDQQIEWAAASDVVMLHDAMQFRESKRAQAAKEKAEADAIVAARNKAKEAPPVQKPGASRNADSKAEKLKELESRFEKSGHIEDLAALIDARGH